MEQLILLLVFFVISALLGKKKKGRRVERRPEGQAPGPQDVWDELRRVLNGEPARRERVPRLPEPDDSEDTDDEFESLEVDRPARSLEIEPRHLPPVVIDLDDESLARAAKRRLEVEASLKPMTRAGHAAFDRRIRAPAPVAVA